MGKLTKRMGQYNKAMKLELREHRSSFIVFMILRTLVVVAMILQLFNKNYENVFLCVLTLILLLVPSIIQLEFRVELPKTLEIIILIFIFAAEILGEIREFYIIFPFWDTLLHTMNGFLAAAIGFAMVDLLNRSEKFTFELSPLFMALVAFCFSMTIGVIWEFFEYAMDSFFGMDMQKDTIIDTLRSVMLDPGGHNVPYVIKDITEVTLNGNELGVGGYLDIGLIDTMMDLFVNFIGAVIFSIFGFFYVKSRGKSKFTQRFIPHLKNEEADFLTQVQKEDE